MKTSICIFFAMIFWALSVPATHEDHTPYPIQELNDTEYVRLKGKSKLYLDITNKNNKQTEKYIQTIKKYQNQIKSNQNDRE